MHVEYKTLHACGVCRFFSCNYSKQCTIGTEHSITLGIVKNIKMV